MPTNSAPRRVRAGRLLFLCTGNSARSQIAEALVEHRSAGAVQARSAGSAPKPLHPNAVRVMAARSIDIAGRPTKSLSRYRRSRFDRVITLCDKVRQICPGVSGHADHRHWSIADPATSGDTDDETFPRCSNVSPTRSKTGGPPARRELSPTTKRNAMNDPEIVNVRYLVDDVSSCVDFYTTHFGFTVGISSLGLR
ncbi:MAG: arsenate reductase ArsC [Acidimicrobiales bacterium]